MRYKVACIGFGTVGQGFAELLLEKGEVLRRRYGLEVDLVAISDPLKGSVCDERGLDLREVLSLIERDGKLEGYDRGVKGWDSIRTIKEAGAEIIVEVTPTNLETGEPGATHIRTALNEGKWVITTNKGPIALFYRELSLLAKEKGGALRFEGTVLAGTPVINLSSLNLAGAEIKEIRGIVNGTTNYILTQMGMGKGYNEALLEAQRLGYAEAKPDADVEGWDAVAKVVILANVVMGGELRVSDVEREGITGITPAQIELSRMEHKRYKLIARAWRDSGGIRARVSPEKLGEDDLLFHISGVTNAIEFVTDTLSRVVVVGPGAGRRETGFAVLNDLLSIVREKGGAQ